MHLLFLDESGTPPKPGVEHPKRFVVGGIIIPEAAWHGLRDGLHGLKVRHGVRGEIKWRHFSPSNDDLKNPMRTMLPPYRNQIRADIFKLICSVRSVRTIASIISTEAAYAIPSINTQNDMYALAYKGVTERFQYHLQDLSRDRSEKQCGIIICDHRSSDDDKILRAHHQKLVHSSGQNFSNYNSLVETLLFCPSHLSVGIQLADLVAGAIWRKYERNDEAHVLQIEASLRRSPAGLVDGYGLIKLPKSNWR